MTFSSALEAIKSGKRARRAGWNGKEQYIELAINITYVDPSGQSCMAVHEDIGSAAIAFHGTRGVQIGWLASQSDMLASDWEFV